MIDFICRILIKSNQKLTATVVKFCELMHVFIIGFKNYKFLRSVLKKCKLLQEDWKL